LLKSITIKMSSTQDFISAQRRLLNLYENGRNLSHEQMVRALDGLLGITQQMVRNRREEFRVANIEPGTPPPRRAVSPEPVVQYRHAAALMRRAEDARREEATRFAGPVRPSLIIREIRANFNQEPRPPMGQRRDWMSWEFYEPTYIKKRSIGKTRFEANCAEPCAICMETHTNGGSVVTQECNHCFGKECWKNWMSNPTSNQTCPTCRQDRPQVITFTMRGASSNTTH